MQTKAKTVTEYMKEVPQSHLDPLTELREICVQNLPGFKEGMEYGTPCYSKNGSTEIAWQSQKNGISLFIKSENIFKKLKELNKTCDINRNNILFKSPEKINFAQIANLIIEVANEKQQPFV